MRVCLGLLGPTLDRGFDAERWQGWRPTVSLFQHDGLLIDRMELIYQASYTKLANLVMDDIRRLSPETEVRGHLVELDDPWDFEAVFSALHAFASDYPFEPDDEEYLLHITTGTHVAQICLFLLAEAGHIPARLIQTSPPSRGKIKPPGGYSVIDLDLSKYDPIFARFVQRQREGVSFLKAGIETRNAPFNALIAQIERVAIASQDPILLMGPTGAGKTQLAGRICELRRSRRQLQGRMVEVNCATLRGDGAMSALFGHVKGAFTGAASARAGWLKAADGGALFLDEIGELGLDEQAMLLRALETGRFMPVGADEEVSSTFQLIAGTNRDLWECVAQGLFREDLLARIDLWAFTLPGLRDRVEDIEPNLDYELERYTSRTGQRVTMNREARARFLAFAQSPQALWRGNFRELNAAVIRMATLAQGQRINAEVVEEEIARLSRSWRAAASPQTTASSALLERVLGQEGVSQLDRFDRAQLEDVVLVCRESASLSEAGRRLFEASRQRKKSSNDADRLRKYLARFGLDFAMIQGA